MEPKRKKTTSNKALKSARKAKSPTQVPLVTPAESEDNGNTFIPNEEGNVEMIDLISDGNSRDVILAKAKAWKEITRLMWSWVIYCSHQKQLNV
jgi:hypothetical protein